MDVEGVRLKQIPKMSWEEVVKEDVRKLGLTRKMALDRKGWSATSRQDINELIWVLQIDEGR